MSSTAIIAIAIPVLVVLAIVVLVTTSRRRDASGATGFLRRETRKRDRSGAAPEALEPDVAPTGREVERSAELVRVGAGLATTESAPPAPYVPPDPETVGVTRRQFFNRSAVALMGLSITGFGAAVIAFLWPGKSVGFGSKFSIGSADDVRASIIEGKGFLYVPEGRSWVVEYPPSALPKAELAYGSQTPVLTGMKAGFAALYQKCPHLGCRVPSCLTSGWFECPCHGSQYNRVGEKKGGPAPRGMDRFGVSVDGGQVLIDTAIIYQGPPIGTNTTGQEAEGPHCVGGGSH